MFATRDVARVAAATGLPLRVRYPKEYRDDGRRVLWELDEEVTAPSARNRALGLLLGHFPARVARDPEEIDDAELLGKSRFIDMDPASTKSALRVRVCVDYDHMGDGTFHELELALALEGAGAYVVHRVQVGWFQQR